MTKYEELEKLQNLKSSGTITAEEFELEKQKILNNSKVSLEKKKVKMSKIFFILTAVFVVITIGVVFYHKNCEQDYIDYMSEHVTDDIELKWGGITKSQYEQIENQKVRKSKTVSTATKMFHISGGITIALLSTGIILKVIEIKKSKK